MCWGRASSVRVVKTSFLGSGWSPKLDPDLPVEAGLPIRVVLAGNSANIARSKIGGLGDLVGGGTRAAPQEKIEQGNIDSVFVAHDIDQFPDGRRRVHGGVVSGATGEESEGFAVIKEQTGLLVAFDLNAKLVGQTGPGCSVV